jgi:hypothetical protein
MLEVVPLPGVLTIDDGTAGERSYSSSRSRSTKENDMSVTPLVMVGSRIEMFYDIDDWYKATVTQLHVGEEAERGVGVHVISNTSKFDCGGSECEII